MYSDRQLLCIEKIKTSSKIFSKCETPIEFEEVLSDSFGMAETFNNFFCEYTSKPRDIDQRNP